MALKTLYPLQKQKAVEINSNAALALQDNLPDCKVLNASILDVDTEDWGGADIVVVKGVLIHISPDLLSEVYEIMYKLTGKYLLVAEYYNPTPVTVAYRGNKDKLFKRDFAGEVMDVYPDLRLVDYGFVYHRDSAFPQDDVTWFLLERC